MRCPKCDRPSVMVTRHNHPNFGLFDNYYCRGCGFEWRMKRVGEGRGWILGVSKVIPLGKRGGKRAGREGR